VHSRAVGVEQSSHFYGQAVLAVVGEEEGFRAAFAFVVAGAMAYRVDVAHGRPEAKKARHYTGQGTVWMGAAGSLA